MKEQDGRIGMKEKLNGTGDTCIVINGLSYRTVAAVNNLAETLTKTLQPLIEWISRPEVAKALEALGKDKGNLREEISNAFEEFCVSGTPYSSFTIFEAGYRAGMKRGD